MINKYTIITCCCFLVAVSCSIEDELRFDPPLEAAFEADRRQIKVGDTVTFRDVSEGLPSQWSWIFEGGSPETSFAHSPIAIYETVGSYAVTLEVRRENKVATVTIPDFITVGYQDLVADFTTESVTVPAGDPVRFTDASAGMPEFWQWEFYNAAGTVATSDEQHPEVVFARPGIYGVRLTVSHPGGSHTVVREEYLTVISANPPQADFTVGIAGIVAGGTVTFQNRSQGDVSGWRWTFEGGSPATSTEENPTVVYPAPGRYAVTLEAYDEITTDTKTKEGYILVVPSDGLVAYYPLDGGGTDLGPSALHPSIIGNVAFNGQGRVGGGTAAQFNGSGLLLVADHPAFNFGTGDFTISCWLNTSNTGRMTIWNESGANAGGDNQAWLRLGDNVTDRKIRFCVEDGSGSTILNIADGVADGQWHQVVCVREGRVSRVYVDGVLVREGTAPASRNVSSEQPFKIGAQETGGGGSYTNHYNGLLDDFLVYGRALSGQEVKALFDLR